jgi:putative hydrolase of the HAD superfamily
MVGNSVENDVVGGNAVGLTTVLFNCDERGLTGHRRPDHRIERFEELREVAL